MSRLDLTNLTRTAGQNIQIAGRVVQDPTVVKATQLFAKDSARVVRSGGFLMRETRSSWLRHATNR